MFGKGLTLYNTMMTSHTHEGFICQLSSPCSPVSSVEDFGTGGRWLEPLARPIFFSRIDDTHYDRIHSSLTPVQCFEDYVGKQPVAWKEYCVEYWLKELKENMDRFTRLHNVTEILLRTEL